MFTYTHYRNISKYLLILTLILFCTNCQSQQNRTSTKSTQIQLKVYSFSQQCEQIQSKYLQVYYADIQKCSNEIGEDFDKLLNNTFANMGLGLGAWSFIGGAKFLITVSTGAKTGMLGLLKAASLAALSSTVTIPLVATAFGLTYLYNYAQNQSMKQNCSKMLQQMKSKIKSQQLEIITKNYNNMIQLMNKIIHIQKIRVQLSTKIKANNTQLDYFNNQIHNLQKYFKRFSSNNTF